MNLLNRIIIWVRHNKGISISTVVLIIMGVPVLIHIAYKIPAPSWLASEWSAGEMLSYYGAVLGFLGTVIFSALALLQNEIIKDEADKNQRMQEEISAFTLGSFLMFRTLPVENHIAENRQMGGGADES